MYSVVSTVVFDAPALNPCLSTIDAAVTGAIQCVDIQC